MTTNTARKLRESSVVAGRVVEAGEQGKFLIKVIEFGEGSSAFYPKEVLERDAALAFPKGTKIFLDHPTYEEEWNQPERSVTKIAGYTTADAYYENGSVYAPVKFGREASVIVEDFKEVLGMSIYAMGESEIGTIGDYTGEVLTHFIASPFNTVDIVTVAGAGGSIGARLTESLKAFNERTPKAALVEGSTMKGKTMAELDEVLGAIASLTATVESLATTSTEKTKAEADEAAVEAAATAKIEAYDASVKAIESADLLPSQAASLRESARKGKEITADLAEAAKIAAEAKEAASATIKVESGRIAESSTPFRSSAYGKGTR